MVEYSYNDPTDPEWPNQWILVINIVYTCYVDSVKSLSYICTFDCMLITIHHASCFIHYLHCYFK